MSYPFQNIKVSWRERAIIGAGWIAAGCLIADAVFR